MELNVALTCEYLENLMELLNGQCNDVMAYGSDVCEAHEDCEGCPNHEVYGSLADLYHIFRKI